MEYKIILIRLKMQYKFVWLQVKYIIFKTAYVFRRYLAFDVGNAGINSSTEGYGGLLQEKFMMKLCFGIYNIHKAVMEKG